jgi:hypothetical protein
MIRVAIVLLMTLMYGCSTIPQGAVSPLPDGCIHLEYFSPTDEINVRRNDTGEVIAVITPTDRVERLIKHWNITEFDKAVAEKEKFIRHAMQESPDAWQLAIPRNLDDLHIPGVVAWNSVKRHLKKDDEIWTFGYLDTGTVIIRNGKLFCMIVVDHQF